MPEKPETHAAVDERKGCAAAAAESPFRAARQRPPRRILHANLALLGDAANRSRRAAV